MRIDDSLRIVRRNLEAKGKSAAQIEAVIQRNLALDRGKKPAVRRVDVLETSRGKILVQAKLDVEQRATRIAELDALVYDTFISDVPQACKVRLDWVYRKAQVVRRGQQGGASYDAAVAAVKFAWADAPRSFNDALVALGVEG